MVSCSSKRVSITLDKHIIEMIKKHFNITDNKDIDSKLVYYLVYVGLINLNNK